MEKYHFVKGLIMGSIIGISTAAIFLIVIGKFGIFSTFPDPESFEAQSYCNQIFNQEKLISGDAVQEWIIEPLLFKFKQETASIPEAGREPLLKASKKYIDTIKSGEVTQTAIVNIAYLVNKAKEKE